MIGAGKHFDAQSTGVLLLHFVNSLVLLDRAPGGEALGAEGAEEGSATVRVFPLLVGEKRVP